METKDILERVNKLSKSSRLKLVEEILEKIKSEDSETKKTQSLLNFAGILSSEEALEMSKNIEMAKKVDLNEW